MANHQERLYRRMSNSTLFYIPSHISSHLKGLDSGTLSKKGIDDYSFDVFSLNEKAHGQGLRYLAYDLLNRYGLTHKFKVPTSTMENFMTQVLHGYTRHKNPYHNDLHAADVTQTVHYMLCQQGLANWLSDLEIFAAIVAAIIHDYDHTGTTNNFHVMSRSETALLYNDRAVLENHHVSTAFRMMREDDCNILFHLSKDEFKEFRTLVIDMVLATDMSSHFQQIKSVKSLISHSEFSIEKSKALSLVLHCCDISHPSKNWDLHHRWTLLLMEEFFLQGDKEKVLGLPYSPLCDRNTTLIAESQIGFIDFIVSPSLEVCGDLLEKIEHKTQSVRAPPITESVSEDVSTEDTKPSALRRKSQSLTGALANAIKRDNSTESQSPPSEPGPSTSNDNVSTSPKAPFVCSKVKRPWVSLLEENKKKWKERTHKVLSVTICHSYPLKEDVTHYTNSTRKLQEHIQMMRKRVCKDPVPKLFVVGDVYPISHGLYNPHCVVLHRCDNDAGCCRRDDLICSPIEEEIVKLHIRVTEPNNGKRKGKTFLMAFVNHTVCGCQEII
nr:calcium/calmodulin-dependent 3',5'-cyclic nucleotide phosphodiesterase 1-like [Parasteatoda tepidariorum]